MGVLSVLVSEDVRVWEERAQVGVRGLPGLPCGGSQEVLVLVEKLMTFEEELLSEFELSVKNGDIVVDPSSDSYFSELDALPNPGKIDWGAVSGSESEQASADAYASDCQHFFDEMMRRYGLSGKCIVVGDSAAIKGSEKKANHSHLTIDNAQKELGGGK